MRLSTDRILTTHVGSLPRPRDVVDLLMAQEQGLPVDPNQFQETMARAVDDVVRQQIAIGLDVVSDGETSKISYATYIKDRLSGFAGDHPRQVALDLQAFPEFRARMAVFAGKQSFKRQACVGPIEIVDRQSLRNDLRNLRAAVQRHGAHDAFMNAA